MSTAENYKFLKFKKDYFIREYLLDTYAHMNNASYIQLYEAARWDVVTERGYGLKTIQELKIGPVILDLSCRFQKEITARETITISTEVTKYKNKIGIIHQEMVKENGDVASVADFTFGLFDMKARKLVLPTEKWLQALGDPL